nr:MAG TPA: hypothetical protein [Caudoviricetes sp.]
MCDLTGRSGTPSRKCEQTAQIVIILIYNNK